MAIMQRPGDFIPGIDCTTGKTLNLTSAEWQQLTRGLAIERSYELDVTRAYDREGKLLYEIFMDRY